jgi:tRNA(fMet)-specific endonuclease VapC
MYLLDTDSVSHWHAGHPRMLQRFQEAVHEDIRTTIITKIEILQGRYDFLLKAATVTELLRAQVLLTGTEQALTRLPIVPLDETAGMIFERLRATKSLKKIGRPDLLIASVALAHRAILVTRNVRHFERIPNLRVENWVD